MPLTKQQTAVAYWVATGLFALFMTKSALAYLTQEAVRVECHHLGFPDYFRVELALVKFLGVLALLLPVGPRPQEWSYAGFTILLGSAIIAHLASGEAWPSAAGPVVLLGVLAASYRLRQRRGGANLAAQPSG